jgi:hypothetical protein
MPAGFDGICLGRTLTSESKHSARAGCGKGDLIFRRVPKAGH